MEKTKAHLEPIAGISITCRYISVDKYNKLTFSLNQQLYEKLENFLIEKSSPAHIRPLSTYFYNEKTYYNLKIKKEHVKKFDTENFQKKEIKLSLSVYEWTNQDKKGVYCRVDNFEVLKTEEDQSYIKPNFYEHLFIEDDEDPLK